MPVNPERGDYNVQFGNLALGLTMSIGVGSPEGVVAAAVGSLYLRSDGGSGTALYVKETGAETSAGWAAK